MAINFWVIIDRTEKCLEENVVSNVLSHSFLLLILATGNLVSFRLHFPEFSKFVLFFFSCPLFLSFLEIFSYDLMIHFQVAPQITYICGWFVTRNDFPVRNV